MFKLAPRICVFAVAVAGLMAQTPPTPVQTVGTTGMVGVAEGQFARFNVLNPGVLPPAIGVVCNALLTFIDAQGAVRKTKLVSVNPGQSAFLDLFGDVDLALAVGERKEIRATFTTPPVIPVASVTPVAAPCTLRATLEVIDALSGKTQVVLGGIHLVPGSAPLN
jgi:hypothetical protein